MLGIYIFFQFIKNKDASCSFGWGLYPGPFSLSRWRSPLLSGFSIVEGMILWDQFLRKPEQVSLTKGFPILLAGATMPFTAFWVYFSQQMPWAQAFHSLVLQYLPNDNVGQDPFYLHTSGLDDSRYNIMQMFDKASVYCMAVILIAVFVYISYQLKEKRYFSKLRMFFIVFLCFVLWRGFHSGIIMDIFRPLPLLLLIFGIFIKRCLVKGKAVTYPDGRSGYFYMLCPVNAL